VEAASLRMTCHDLDRSHTVNKIDETKKKVIMDNKNEI